MEEDPAAAARDICPASLRGYANQYTDHTLGVSLLNFTFFNHCLDALSADSQEE